MMGISEEMFEALAGKFIDGEISAAEQRLLDAELRARADRREFFEQMKRLHEMAREAIAEELGGSASPEDVFERAWAHRGGRRIAIPWTGGWVRFAAGLAAGLVVGLAWHLNVSRPPVEAIEPNTGQTASVLQTGQLPLAAGSAKSEHGRLERMGDISRRVDWYGFTDPQGNRWIVEGLRENRIVPASYGGDL